MEGGRVYGGSNMTVMFQNDRLSCSPEVLESLWIPNSSPSFHGDSRSCSTSMVNFEDIRVGNPTDHRPFFPPLEEKEEDGNEDYDSCLHHQPEKKRRLTADQVQFLERNFEVENKLEPERKVQLAKELGLQPRQVAIWFQNRRARFKTKQLEKEYDSLKASYDKLNADYDSLLKEKERLKNEVCLLTEKLLLREKESTNSKPTHLINPATEEPQKKTSIADCENKSEVPMVFCKQDDVSSAKSDVSDSDSLNCASGNHSSSLLEPADSSVALGPDQSDFSQDDEDELTRTLLPLPCLVPKLEEGCYSDPSANCCNWNFPVEGQPSWLWPY